MKPLVFLCTPCYGGQLTTRYAAGLIDAIHTLDAYGCGWATRFVANESLITRARCRLAHDFLKSGGTHLFFIDADVGFDGGAVASMVEKQIKHRFDVLAALYPKKSLFWPGIIDAAQKNFDQATVESAGAKFPFNRKNRKTDTDEMFDGCVEVFDAPTGFMCIARQTIERVIEAAPHDWYLSDSESDYGQPTYLLFDTIVGDNRRFLSEDYAFCRKVQNAKMRVWVDTSVSLQHLGQYAFSGRMSDLIQPAGAAEIQEVQS